MDNLPPRGRVWRRAYHFRLRCGELGIPITPEPSHVLPTGGGARFGSPLRIPILIAQTSLIATPPQRSLTGPSIVVLARRGEGWTARAKSSGEIRRCRRGGNKSGQKGPESKA
jgi:hypothetical protein